MFDFNDIENRICRALEVLRTTTVLEDEKTKVLLFETVADMLRHLMSTELLHKGNSVIARDLLGHTFFSMTLDYARSTDKQLYEAIKDRKLLPTNLPTFTYHYLPPITKYDKAYNLMMLELHIIYTLFFC